MEQNVKCRQAEVTRKTGETDITIRLNLDGTGKASIQTGIGFFDHMLNSFARHGLFDLEVQAKGDLEVDCHHTIEDHTCAIIWTLQFHLWDSSIQRWFMNSFMQ